MLEDIRHHPVDGRTVWRDGHCLDCGAPTYGSDARHAGPEAFPPLPERRLTDYYIWCSAPTCDNYAGECVSALACPPDWAHHTAVE